MNLKEKRLNVLHGNNSGEAGNRPRRFEGRSEIASPANMIHYLSKKKGSKEFRGAMYKELDECVDRFDRPTKEIHAAPR